MIEFILNNQLYRTPQQAGLSLLDFIRYEAQLTGTKSGCREGDCGACTVMLGEMNGDQLTYKSIASCMTPIGNVHQKHVVTIEGISSSELTPIQHAIVENSATQCGFCTPGIVMSLTAHTLNEQIGISTVEAVAGNICRCTGYQSIKNAAYEIAEAQSLLGNRSIPNLVEKQYLPTYFLQIADRLQAIATPSDSHTDNLPIGGGTDLMVQQPDNIRTADLNFVGQNKAWQYISHTDSSVLIGAATTANQIMHDEQMQQIIPKIKQFFLLISSEQIRNTATVAGNFVNASPIGDLSIFFLALNASLELSDGKHSRMLALDQFFKSYKQLDLNEGERITQVQFPAFSVNQLFNFEKVSKRTHLDIASVNSAISLEVTEGVIQSARLSFGGVSPVPFFAKETSAFFIDKPANKETLNAANAILQKEISPITDVRGSVEYKRLLAQQLLLAHFIELSLIKDQ